MGYHDFSGLDPCKKKGAASVDKPIAPVYWGLSAIVALQSQELQELIVGIITKFSSHGVVIAQMPCNPATLSRRLRVNVRPMTFKNSTKNLRFRSLGQKLLQFHRRIGRGLKDRVHQAMI